MFMSAPFGINALTFSDVVKQLRTTFETFSDRRTGKNINYTLTDAGLSAFSVFFMQSPSFLEFQRTMQETQGGNTKSRRFRRRTNTVRCLPNSNRQPHPQSA